MSKSTPSFVQPFLYALNRMQENESLRPAQYTERALALLVDRFGVEGAHPEAAFSHGSVGLLADHTHYFDGFAMMLQLRQGTAVAARIRENGENRLVFEGMHASVDAVFSALVNRVFGTRVVDVAVVSALPRGLGVSYIASLATAMVRTRNLLDSVSMDERKLAETVQSMVSDVLGTPISRVFSTGASLPDDGPFVIVDASNGKYLQLEVPANQRPGFALISLDDASLLDASGMKARRELVSQATRELASKAFPKLTSLRDLEHRDLDRAVEAVARKYRPAVRHVVSANRNVQKLAVAIRKTDWQFFGALLKISQASIMQDWTTGHADFGSALEAAERLSLEGIYGVVQTGELGVLLVVGQPFSIPAYLDALRDPHTNRAPEAFIV